ncbi:glutathione S-transferase [uncultured Pseudoteredinibacter sp.]|uniref:glutathione S-transferase n=1 Tax=uncultured Pseudoteredinibacter sp. TaxID=1641701 RepID=UPI0026057082|nr:glutathione S-transferase [uncultured Pseudoteredinibacter sp.]
MLPILYSFRRCPYAMRARLAIHYCDVEVDQRDILLKDKPKAMLEASPKGTVPVLVLANGEVIDESRDIMMWALQHGEDKHGLLGDQEQQHKIEAWLDDCDNNFKPELDKYKYWVGYPEASQLDYRQRAEVFIQALEDTLNQHNYLLGEKLSAADIGIFPFIRQFANVDIDWFGQAPYPKVQQWLGGLVGSDEFIAIMVKREIWSEA